MEKVPPTFRDARARALYGSDTEVIDEVVRVIRATQGQPAAAKKYLLVWLLAQAHYEGTTMGAVLAKLVQTQPSRNDQYGLLRKLRERLREEG